MLNQQVLLLNATYEPISIVGLRHAIGLLCLEKVQTVEANGAIIRSPSIEIEAPSVIRLNNYVKIRKRKAVKFSRRNIIKRDRHQCMYCGKNDIPLTIDHVLPRSLKGRSIWENVVACCPECNSKKGNKTPRKAGMRLLSKPKEPTVLTFIRNSYLSTISNKPEWKKYLFFN